MVIFIAAGATVMVWDLRNEAIENASGFIATGAVCAAIGFVFLIRVLARSAAAVRYSEGRWRSFAEIFSNWFWEQNAELRYTWFSDAVDRPGLRFNLIDVTRWEMVTEGVTEEQWAEHKAILAARHPFRDFRYVRRGEDGAVHDGTADLDPTELMSVRHHIRSVSRCSITPGWSA